MKYCFDAICFTRFIFVNSVIVSSNISCNDLSWDFIIMYVVFCQLKFNIGIRCDMAFIEPMHRNKPNITYLLTCPQHWTMWWASSWIVVATTSRGWRTFIAFTKIVSFGNGRTQPTAWKSIRSQCTVVTPRGSTAFSRWTRAVTRFMTLISPHVNLGIVMVPRVSSLCWQ